MFGGGGRKIPGKQKKPAPKPKKSTRSSAVHQQVSVDDARSETSMDSHSDTSVTATSSNRNTPRSASRSELSNVISSVDSPVDFIKTATDELSDKHNTIRVAALKRLAIFLSHRYVPQEIEQSERTFDPHAVARHLLEPMISPLLKCLFHPSPESVLATRILVILVLTLGIHDKDTLARWLVVRQTLLQIVSSSETDAETRSAAVSAWSIITLLSSPSFTEAEHILITLKSILLESLAQKSSTPNNDLHNRIMESYGLLLPLLLEHDQVTDEHVIPILRFLLKMIDSPAASVRVSTAENVGIFWEEHELSPETSDDESEEDRDGGSPESEAPYWDDAHENDEDDTYDDDGYGFEDHSTSESEMEGLYSDLTMDELKEAIVERVTSLVAESTKSRSKKEKSEFRRVGRTLLSCIENGRRPRSQLIMGTIHLHLRSYHSHRLYNMISRVLADGFTTHLENNSEVQSMFDVLECGDRTAVIRTDVEKVRRGREGNRREGRDIKQKRGGQWAE